MKPQITKTQIKLYTDGACSPNPGIGGWGAVLISEQHQRRRELSGSEKKSTNNRMEMQAAIEGLSALKHACTVKLYTDSTYLRNAFVQGWLKQWQKRGWKTASKQPVANRDLWLTLIKLTEKHEVEWHWVKGHSNNPENNCCDTLAVEARKNLKQQLKS